MQLIINGDDFGYSPGQNYGIVDAYQNGILRSTSMMARGQATDQAVALAKANPGLGVGVHLVLDYGRPVLPLEVVPSLTGGDGAFLRPPFEEGLQVSLTEVEREWRAQIELIRGLGITPTHLDGHHHFHLHPQLFSITCALAREFDLPIRPLPWGWDDGAFAGLNAVKHPDVCLVDFYGPGVSEGFFTDFFTTYPDLEDRTVEVMCHPAYVDDYILGNSKYNFPRVRELQVLKSALVWTWVEENNIQLINYTQL